MKTTIVKQIAIILYIASIISCSSSDDDSSNQNTAIEIMSAKITGVNKEFNPWLFVYHEDFISIMACENEWEIRLQFPNSVGTHPLIEEPNSAIIEFGDPCCLAFCDIVTTYHAVKGSVTVTQANETKVKGTFFFTATADGEVPKVIDEGIFEIEYDH